MGKKPIQDATDALHAEIDALFAEEEIKPKGKVHYLRFDQTPIKMRDGKEIIPATDGWTEVATFLRATDVKTMLKKLIGLAILGNRRRRELQEKAKQPDATGKDEETKES